MAWRSGNRIVILGPRTAGDHEPERSIAIMSYDAEVESTDHLSDPSEVEDSADVADEALGLKLRPAEFVMFP